MEIKSIENEEGEELDILGNMPLCSENFYAFLKCLDEVIGHHAPRLTDEGRHNVLACIGNDLRCVFDKNNISFEDE